MQTGSELVIRPTTKQIEGALGAILANVGIPLAIELASKIFGKGLSTLRSGGVGLSTLRKPSDGRGLQVSRQPGYLMPYQPPPFFGTWENPVGNRMSKRKKGQGLLLGKNSSFNGIPLLGTIL